jgi:hypothetical protein
VEPKPRSVEVTTISESGFSVRVEGRELFVAFDQFPWFRHARVSDLFQVELVTPDQLRWPTIDADLSVRSIEHPEEFPLVSRPERVKEAPTPSYQPARAGNGVIRIDVPHEAIAAFCRERGIRRLAFFGSVLRDDFTPESDVDVLVEFEPERIPGLFKLMGYQHRLGEILGRVVDLRLPGDLSKYFRDEVLAEAVEVYDAS